MNALRHAAISFLLCAPLISCNQDRLLRAPEPDDHVPQGNALTSVFECGEDGRVDGLEHLSGGGCAARTSGVTGSGGYDRICISFNGANSVGVFDTSTGERIATNTGPHMFAPRRTAIDLEGNCISTGMRVHKFRRDCHPDDPNAPTDECLVFDVAIGESMTSGWEDWGGAEATAIAVDGNNDIWAGSYSVTGTVDGEPGAEHVHIDGETGEILHRVPSMGSYGMTALPDGNVASISTFSAAVEIIDVAQARISQTIALEGHMLYGIAAGPEGIYGASGACIFFIERDAATNTYATTATRHCPPGFDEGSGDGAREPGGLPDQNGDIYGSYEWVRGLSTRGDEVFAAGYSLHKVYVYDAATGDYVDEIAAAGTDRGPMGIGLDREDNLWIVYGDSRTLTVFDPSHQVVRRRAIETPYVYGDMTGNQLHQLHAGRGTWTVDAELSDGMRWQQLRWVGSTPAGTHVTVKVDARCSSSTDTYALGPFGVTDVDLSSLPPEADLLTLTFDLEGAVDPATGVALEPEVTRVELTQEPL